MIRKQNKFMIRKNDLTIFILSHDCFLFKIPINILMRQLNILNDITSLTFI